ncbi:MAG: hypothetical protein NZ849_12090 [Meiothermus sp.]|uniref:hypothetical protein n=1 Tax=Meiothermus sp. TaxID=1955249 RepID=UPI0025CEAA05|nr:hypothetical protein [Meiothermus sp.]MCS7057487.1 hypothetical protein [Meiothermus sp.]MCS7195633.1 hypothetical protein [Meiothermus sp.]MCX7739754.1 hypothetical protein [Meiothermus sp.]MDW8091827.1 hypothetical protein [Meiothermus sp.]MDW8480910.1 hypothetical protein [Meiothermus sp.]
MDALEQNPPRRLVGEVVYVLLLSAPRVVAEGVRARLAARQIPVYLETPFLGLPEVYLGTYTGGVGLWVPEALYQEAVLIIERDS